MQDVSGRWDAATRLSGNRIARCEVWRAGVSQGLTLSLSDGSVRLDERSNVRRALSVSSGDSTLMPSPVSDRALWPTDTDLQVFAGLAYPQGDSEMVPVGVFRLSSVTRSSLRSHEISIEGGDYASVLAAHGFERPWNLPAGSSVTAHIRAMVLETLPWVEVVDLTGSKRAAPAGSGAFESDRWGAIRFLADSIAADVGFDAYGRFVVKPMPTLKSEPDIVVDYGLPRSIMTDVGVSVSADRVYNSVTASSSADDVTAWATIRRTDGPFAWRAGYQRPRRFASPLLRSGAQCAAAARSILARSGALTEEVTPRCAPNPAVDIGDTVGVPLPGRGLLLRILSGATVPLGLGEMSLTTRTVAEGLPETEGLGE